MFNSLKRAFGAAATEVRAEYAENKDYLEAVCASCALVANADGNVSDVEKTKAISAISNHPTLSKLYNRQDIETTFEVMLKRSKDSSGRQQLARELDDIKTRPNAAQMSEDVYLVALDVAGADGSVGDDEQAVLDKIAKRIGVDTSKFEF